MWSPMYEKDGRRNQAYENMKAVVPGDYVFSHFDQHISAIGTIQSYAYQHPRPSEFSESQYRWVSDGWRVDIKYISATHKLNPKSHFKGLKRLLPEKYSPLDKSGKAAQKLYLTEVSSELAHTILKLMGLDEEDFPSVEHIDSQDEIENAETLDGPLIKSILENYAISETEKRAIIASRRGQGLFRKRLALFESRCRVSGVSNPCFLIASHIKPWRYCSNVERLDGENGLFLSPSIDRLFDRNFISFSEQGELIISQLLTVEEQKQFGLDKTKDVGLFTLRQKQYLAFHRSRLKPANSEK